MTQPPNQKHPLNDDNSDDWDSFDTITGEATPHDPPNARQTPRQTPQPSTPMPPAKYSWSEVWTSVLTRPHVQTFQELLTDPRADGRRAYSWFFLTFLVSTFVTLSVFFNNTDFMEAIATSPDFAEMQIDIDDVQTGFITITLLIAVPMTAGFGVVVFAIFVYAVNYVAVRVATGKKSAITTPNLGQLAFVLSASLAPLNLISAFFIIMPIPFIGFGLTLYQIYLLILGVRAIYGFEWRDAATSILVPTIGLFFLQITLISGFL